MHHRTFVRCDGVHAELEGCAQVVDGGLTGFIVHRRVFKQDIRLRLTEEIQRVVRGGQICKRPQALPRSSQVQRLIQVQPTGGDGGSVASGCDAGDRKAELVCALQLVLFAQQQAGQRLTDVSKAQQGQFIVGHTSSSIIGL